MNRETIYIASAMFIVTTSATLGLMMSGSPSTARDQYRDRETLKDLVAAYNAGFQQTLENDRAPVDLDGVSPHLRMSVSYDKTGTKSFRLCANFLTDTRDHSSAIDNQIYGHARLVDWRHPSGEFCVDASAN